MKLFNTFFRGKQKSQARSYEGATTGPGYCHYPIREIYNVEYFHQLTVEKRVLRYKQGRPFHTYIKPSGERNEALDCRVYALAALYIVNPNMVPIKKNETKLSRKSYVESEYIHKGKLAKGKFDIR